MMEKANTGILFYNDKATGKQPNYTGHCMLDGIEYKIVGWDRQGPRTKFISMAFEPKSPRSEPASQKPKAPLREEDIPF